jgi:DNA uptake protein ComE-like DNA-binding protein
MHRRGFILLLTLIFMTVLAVVAGAMIYYVSRQMQGAAPQKDDMNLESLADAGIEKAHRAIRDDYLTTTATGVADLRGGAVYNSASGTTVPANSLFYIGSSNATISANGSWFEVGTLDSNYANAKIVSIVPYIRAAKSSPSGNNPTVTFSYSTNASGYTMVLTQTLTSSTITQYAGTAITGLTWSQIMSANFRLRATGSGISNRNVVVDAMWLRVTYGIDTLKESWATGSYATFPISLGSGSIQSIAITDEASKVHLNYASQSLLTNLLTNLGVSSASTKAANIVSYRGASLTNPFDSVEELQQVSGITASDYTAVKDYVTVYSFQNSNVYRPTGPRAPVNINTASNAVLKSAFDSLALGAGDAQSLANDIITFRNSTPFTCFYSADAAVTTDFYDFVVGRSYISGTGSPSERDMVMDTADASSLIPRAAGATGYNCPTTELCYAGYTFMIDCLARYNSRNLRVKTIRGNDGAREFATYVGDATLTGWRKENFE